MPRRRSSSDKVNGSNRSELIFTGSGNDTINANGGNDWIFSGRGDDIINAGDGNDVVFGGSGNDQIDGGAGNDLIYGGSGDDNIDGGSGNDRIFGGTGNDTIDGGSGNDLIFGGTGNNKIDGGTGNDRIFGGSGADEIEGGDGNDLIFGGSGDDNIDGGSGNDRIFGGSGDDEIDGGVGNDLIFGGSGADIIDGGAGRDRIYAGSGNDTLIYTLPETAAPSSVGPDYYSGGSGFDTLRINLTAAQAEDADLVAELSAYLDALDAGTSSYYVRLPSLNLAVTSIEAAEIYVDGVLTDIRDTGGDDVTAVDDSFTVGENGTLSDSVASNDTAPAGATFTVVTPVTAGTLALNADGTFTYDPEGAYDTLADGATATQEFTYQLSQGGETATATATITITGANDAPTVTTAVSASVAENDAPASINLLQGAADVDNGSSLSVANLTGLVSGLSLSGNNLEINTSDPSIQALSEGEIQVITLDYDVVDEHGASVTQTATISITGSNDVPTVSGAITAAATEDGAAQTISLLDGALDIDTSTTLSVDNVSALPAGVTLSGTDLTIDPSHADYQNLAIGETTDVTVNYDIVDGDGGSVAQTATITITGTNDAPTVSSAITAGAQKNEAAFDVDLLQFASDVDTGTTFSVENVTGLTDGVTLSGTTLTVDPSNAAFAGLTPDDSLDITVSFDVIDGDGGSVSQTATITITGSDSNQPPVVTGPVEADVSEDASSGVDIDLLAGASDPDGTAPLTVQNVSTLPEGFTLSGTTLTVDPSHEDYQSLAAGATQEITVTYDIADELNATVAQTATITIIGQNDVPEVAAAITASATEDGTSVTVELLDGASDVDAGTDLDVANVSALPAGVTLSGTALTVDPSNAAYQSLAAGVTQDISITYDVIDGDGGSVAQTATITITGTNDVPVVAAAITASATEDGTPVAINLLDGATDVDAGTNLSVANISALPAGVTMDGTTGITFDPSNAAYQSLAAGVTQDISITYDIVDGDGGSVAQTATITITGTNDVPVVAAAITASATEDGTPVAINLLDGATDVDAGTNLSVANISALPAGVTMDGTTGITFDPSDAAYQSLAAGVTQDISISYDVVDGAGGSVAQTATITVTGTNDAPAVSNAVIARATEDGAALTVSLLDGVTDVDIGDTLDVTNVSTLPDGVTLSGTELTIDPSHASFQSLALDATRDITVTYDVVDGNGGSVAQTATITVVGINDAPVVSAAVTGSVTEDATAVTVSLLDGVTDVDIGDTLDVTNVSALPDGVTLSGTELTIDPSHASFQSLALDATRDITVTYDVFDGFGGIVAQTATITVTGTNDTPTVAAALDTTVAEDADSFTVELLIGANDVDDGSTLSVTNLNGLVPGVTQNGNAINVDPGHTAFQSLNVGQNQNITLTYDVEDEHGASVPQSLTITITGTNDTPTVEAALSETAAEDADGFTVELLAGANDVDDGSTLSVTNLNGLVPGVTQNGNAIDVDPSHAAFQSLNVGQSQDITLTYDVEDEHGASVPQSAQITITGTNDTPTVDAALEAETNEDDAVLTVNLLEGAADIDDGAELNVASVTGMGPGFTLNGNSLEVDPSVAAYQPIALGEFVTYTVNYNVVDEHGASVAQSATITINGTNDTPVVTGSVDTQFTQTDVAYSMTLDADLFFDIDTTDTLTLSATLANGDPLPSWLTFDAVTGTFSGTPDDQRHAQLFRIEVTATDPHGESATTGFWMGQGDAFLNGTTTDNDTVSGTNDDGDILFGGEGTDVLHGLDNTDLYVVTADNDFTAIEENGFYDNDILLLDGIAPADVTFDRRHPGSSDLVISVSGSPLVLIHFALEASSWDEVESIAFGDGSMVSMADIRAILVSQQTTTGADFVAGFDESDDNIVGGTGNDYLSGADGSDTYVFNTGDGQDVIYDSGFYDTDVVLFADRASPEATFSRVPGESSSVLISFANGDSVLLRNALNGSAYNGIEQVQFAENGATLTIDQIRDILINQEQTNQDDNIVGFDRDDTIEAGLGNDRVDGSEGTDTYIFNSGDGQDIIDESGFNDVDSVFFTDYALADATFERIASNSNDISITFSNGDRVILRDSFNDTLYGGVERIVFQGTDVDEILTDNDIRSIIFSQDSTTGNDRLVAGSNDIDDTLEAGQGDDYMSGGDGSDTYIFGTGDGRDVIYDAGYNDTDVLNLSDFASTDMTVRLVEGRTADYVLSFATGEEITIVNQTGSAGQIESFIFSDTTLTAEQIGTLATAGTSPGDVFTGDSSANTLSGDGGYDHLFGGGGSDTYVFDAGDERVEIEENGNTASDELVVNGYSSTDATFMRVEGRLDLRIVFANSDEITIRNGLESGSDTVENFTFDGDGITLSIADIRQLLVDGQSSSGNDTIYGYSLDDTLAGGTGDDFLSGGAGGDLYVFNAGDGNDEIRDSGGYGLDRVEINDYSFSDATITRVPGTAADILLDFGSGDSVLIRGTLSGPFGDGIEEIVFNGGGSSQAVTMQEVRDHLASEQASDGDDIIIGSGSSDTLAGGLGDDYLSGSSSSDTYIYALGDDNDVIEDNGAGSVDVVEIYDTNSSDVTVTRAIDDLYSAILTMSDGSTIRLVNTLSGSYSDTIEQVNFIDDNVTWTMQDLRDQIIAGQVTSGDDDIIGWSTSDVILGGAGNDYLSGGNGSDTYVFNVEDGNDLIIDNGAGSQDEIVFNDRNAADATFSRLHNDSDDLLIEFANGDSVVVRYTISGSYSNTIEEYTFDDATLTHADMLLLL